MTPNNKKKKIAAFSQDKIIEKSSSIKINKKTVSFGSEVYQFHNVTGFGLSKVPHKRNYTLIALACFSLLFGLLTFNLYSPKYRGVLIIIFSSFLLLGETFFSIYSTYVFKIYLNSGNCISFATRDRAGIKKVVSKLYDFMQNEKENSYEITVNHNSINIHQEGSFGIGVAMSKIADFAGGTISSIKEAGVSVKKEFVRYLESLDKWGKKNMGNAWYISYLIIQDLIVILIVLQLAALIEIWIRGTSFLGVNIYILRLASLRLASERLALMRLAPMSWALERSAATRLAIPRLASMSWALERSAPMRLASMSLASERLASTRLAILSLALLRLASVRSAPVRLALIRQVS